MKVCVKCFETKPTDQFGRDSRCKDGLKSWCKACESILSRVWYAKNTERVLASKRAYRERHPDRIKAGMARYKETHREQIQKNALGKHLRNRFGLSETEYAAMLGLQGGGCAICGRPPGRLRLGVDHDHATGAVRGLLCHRCNSAAGMLDDDPVRMERLAAYVRSGGTGDRIRVVLTTGEETLSKQGDPQ